MPGEQRSLSEILQNTIRNIQEIVRSEVHLAKSEIREEFAKAKASALCSPWARSQQVSPF